MPSQRRQPPKAPARKVIELDLASMLEDDTLSGVRQLSALRIEPASASGAAAPATNSSSEDPGSLLENPGSVLPEPAIQTDPGFSLADRATKPIPGFTLSPRSRPLRTVEDGLHAGELQLLRFLWSEGVAVESDPEARVVSLGNATIRRQGSTGPRKLGRSTVKRLLKSLARKRCVVQCEAATMRSAARWKIFNDRRILRARRESGWNEVVRDRRAVVLWDGRRTAE
jgi:hypothetical protein